MKVLTAAVGKVAEEVPCRRPAFVAPARHAESVLERDAVVSLPHHIFIALIVDML